MHCEDKDHRKPKNTHQEQMGPVLSAEPAPPTSACCQVLTWLQRWNCTLLTRRVVLSWQPRDILWDQIVLAPCKKNFLFNLAWSETWTGLPPADEGCTSSPSSPEFWSTSIQPLQWELWAGRFCCFFNIPFSQEEQPKPHYFIFMWVIFFKIYLNVYFSMCSLVMVWKHRQR